MVANSNIGWRWPDWTTLIISGAAFLVALVFLPETHLPLLLDWKAKELRRATGDSRYTSTRARNETFASRLKHNVTLGARFWTTELVIVVFGLYLILLYILPFTFLSGFDYIFKETYHLSEGLLGSCFASIGLGSTACAVTAPWLYSLARSRTVHV
jgi:hypothetical protein